MNPYALMQIIAIILMVGGIMMFMAGQSGSGAVFAIGLAASVVIRLAEVVTSKS